MATVNIRYIVNDVQESIGFYTGLLGFKLELHPAPPFAILSLGDARLLLNQPGAGGAGQPADDGRTPEPGGWNRLQIQVADIDAVVSDLKAAGARIRTDIVNGNGGRQAIVEDPSGNPLELLQPN